MAVVPDESITTFFPEPAADDPTWAKAREGMARWLERSTLPRARAFRQFLNQNLAALAGPAALAIAQDMRTADFYRAHFEMVVGRTLQVLGGDLRYEVATVTGRRPDWPARFPSGGVVVEATSPAVHLEEEQKRTLLGPVVQLVERLAPEDWSVVVYRLPELGPNDSRAELRRFLEARFALVPPAAHATRHVEIEAYLDCGGVHLELIPRRIAHTKIVMGPGVATYGDDTAARVAGAYAAKRAQVRDVAGARVLAVHGGNWSGCSAFDGGLFGVGEDALSEPAFVMHRVGEPVFTAVLAFPGLELTQGREPVLYRHPRATLPLPVELEELEVRTLASGRVIARPSQLAQGVFPQLLGDLVIP